MKLDTTREEIWRRLDRPYRKLQLAAILEGMLEFAEDFKGELVTETMLVQGVNDCDRHLEEVADFLAQLRPARAYLSIPTRPPAETWVQAPGEEVSIRTHQILQEKVDQVEYLIGYEGNAFAFTGDVEEDLLSITAVHPMRQEAVSEFLTRAGADWTVVQRLIDGGQLVETSYEGKNFYVRKLMKQNLRRRDEK